MAKTEVIDQKFSKLEFAAKLIQESDTVNDPILTRAKRILMILEFGGVTPADMLRYLEASEK